MRAPRALLDTALCDRRATRSRSGVDLRGIDGVDCDLDWQPMVIVAVCLRTS
jgi:hypothetical protein